LRDRLGIVEDAGLSGRWRASPFGCAQSEKLTDIHHFGLGAQALLHQSDGRESEDSVHMQHIASWRVLDHAGRITSIC
jgi:hypothetical protein